MSKRLVDLELLERVTNMLDAHNYAKDAEAIMAAIAQPADAEGVERQRMIESMCLTWRHDFGLDAPAPGSLASGMTESGRQHLRGEMGKLFDHHFAPVLSAVTAERDGEAESCEQWRNLALQFDRHRMSALAHLKMVVAGQEGALDACRGFLSAPPVPGHAITEEIDQLRAEVEALRAMAQRANTLLRQIADSGYDDDSVDALTCWLEEHPGAKLFARVSAMAAKEA